MALPSHPAASPDAPFGLWRGAAANRALYAYKRGACGARGDAYDDSHLSCIHCGVGKKVSFPPPRRRSALRRAARTQTQTAVQSNTVRSSVNSAVGGCSGKVLFSGRNGVPDYGLKGDARVLPPHCQNEWKWEGRKTHRQPARCRPGKRKQSCPGGRWPWGRPSQRRVEDRKRDRTRERGMCGRAAGSCAPGPVRSVRRSRSRSSRRRKGCAKAADARNAVSIGYRLRRDSERCDNR